MSCRHGKTREMKEWNSKFSVIDSGLSDINRGNLTLGICHLPTAPGLGEGASCTADEW